jgi:hypothetical protein
LGEEETGLSEPGCLVAEVDVYGFSHLVSVRYCPGPGLGTFAYASPYTEDSIFAPYLDDLFFYYDGEQALDVYRDKETQGRYVVLDPAPPPGAESFIDLCYHQDLRISLEEYLSGIISALSGRVKGFVLGDEWPRGLNGATTVQGLAGYNSTFHQETGLWIRENPSNLEKTRLAEWFYSRSIQAWDRIARVIRSRFPEIYLGTNIDLVWEPDLEGRDVAHWSQRGVWGQVDLEPYDFVVAHYFTKMPYRDQEDPGLMEVDRSSITILRNALESLAQSGLMGGRDLFLLLGAHCAYPYVITPGQMVEEWNTALGFWEHLAGVGWFTYDIWSSGDLLEIRSVFDSSAPLARARRHTISQLSELNRCAWSASGCEARLRVAPDTFYLLEGEEAELHLTLEPEWPQAKVRVTHIAVAPRSQYADPSLVLGDCLVWRKGRPEGCIGDQAPWVSLRPDGSGGCLTATIPIRILDVDMPTSFAASLQFVVAIGKQSPPCPQSFLVHHARIDLRVIPQETHQIGQRLELSGLVLLSALSLPVLKRQKRTQP